MTFIFALKPQKMDYEIEGLVKVAAYLKGYALMESGDLDRLPHEEWVLPPLRRQRARKVFSSREHGYF